MTIEQLAILVDSNTRWTVKRLQYLKDLYEGRHPIQLAAKETNRGSRTTALSATLQNTLSIRFNGYFIGIPVKTMHPDAAVAENIGSRFSSTMTKTTATHELCKILQHLRERV